MRDFVLLRRFVRVVRVCQCVNSWLQITLLFRNDELHAAPPLHRRVRSPNLNTESAIFNFFMLVCDYINLIIFLKTPAMT